MVLKISLGKHFLMIIRIFILWITAHIIVRFLKFMSGPYSLTPCILNSWLSVCHHDNNPNSANTAKAARALCMCVCKRVCLCERGMAFYPWLHPDRVTLILPSSNTIKTMTAFSSISSQHVHISKACLYITHVICLGEQRLRKMWVFPSNSSSSSRKCINKYKLFW